jgi:hypothetical protein
MPIYGPHYSHPDYFEWSYRVAYRRPGGSNVDYQPSDSSRWIGTWEMGLVDATSNSPNWDEETSRAHHKGQGIYLYEPASDDPKLCPGLDWSRYECGKCGTFVKPFSNDEGDLICPWCEATGLIITDDEQLDRLEQAREFARSMGLSSQLERQLSYLHNYAHHDDGPRKRQCVLAYDFAYHSFSFAHYTLPAYTTDGKRHMWFHGGLIYQAPESPANGSFPSLTVSLASGIGWFCHT